jgi:hypothetical protein
MLPIPNKLQFYFVQSMYSEETLKYFTFIDSHIDATK